jgi:tRNA nucleotidyltransferase (CCA-adding enzyme)
MTTVYTIFEQLRLKFKEYYFRNGLQNKNIKNPIEMTEIELLAFCELHKLHDEYISISNEVAKNYYILESKLELNVNKIPEDVKYIMNKLWNFSTEVYLVGGCVRDLLLDKTPKDFDIVTDISYDEMTKIFSGSEFKIKETGKQFLVFNLNYNGNDYEIANFRKDGYSSDGRRPDEVSIGTIQEDAARRDFTINSIYYNINGVKANYQSILDILNKKIRFVGNPEDRLKEDYLRGWRFLRFANTFKNKGFTVDEKSMKAIRRNWDNIYNASNPTRVMLELEKII